MYAKQFLKRIHDETNERIQKVNKHKSESLDRVLDNLNLPKYQIKIKIKTLRQIYDSTTTPIKDKSSNKSSMSKTSGSSNFATPFIKSNLISPIPLINEKFQYSGFKFNNIMTNKNPIKSVSKKNSNSSVKIDNAFKNTYIINNNINLPIINSQLSNNHNIYNPQDWQNEIGNNNNNANAFNDSNFKMKFRNNNSILNLKLKNTIPYKLSDSFSKDNNFS